MDLHSPGNLDNGLVQKAVQIGILAGKSPDID
jgi:hypothetical protein